MIHVCWEWGGVVGSVQLEFTPLAIATSQKYVWVCDPDKNEVFRIELDSQYRASHTHVVSLSDGFTGIGRIAVNEERLAVCEDRGKVVHMYTVEGALLHTCEVIRRDEGGKIWDVGLDSCNFVYAANFYKSRIAILTPEGQLTRHVCVDLPLYLSVSNNTLCVRWYDGLYDGLYVDTYRLVRN